MHYIIQEDIFQESHYKYLINAMERLELPYNVVRVYPFVEKIVELKLIPENPEDLNVEAIPELEIPRNKKVFVFGSVKLARICAEKNWYPGSMLNEKHDFEVYREYYKDNLLNYDSVITTVSNGIQWNDEYQFIRPTKDSKAFNGKVYTQKTWNDVLDERLCNEKFIFNENTPIQVSTIKTIYKEIRFWVVNGKVIIGSQYAIGGKVEYNEYYEEEAFEFAQKMVDLYQIADAFVIDVCLTDNGWKIVECNCINCAGFYHANLQKLIMELEYFYEPELVYDRAEQNGISLTPPYLYK